MSWAVIKAWTVRQCQWCHHPAVLGAVAVVGALTWIDIYRSF